MPCYNINKNQISKSGYLTPNKGKGIIVFWSPLCQWCVKKKPVFKSIGKDANVYMFELKGSNPVNFMDVEYIPQVHYVNKNGKISKIQYNDKLTKNALLEYIKYKNK